MKHGTAALGLTLIALLASTARADDRRLSDLVASPSRSERNVARDRYRHPFEVLSFFGVRDDQEVVEILPGGSGYWTEILAPLLRAHGTYYAVLPSSTDTSDESSRTRASFDAKLASDPARFDRVLKTSLGPGPIAPAASADLILTFRNVHNWISDGTADAVFRSFYAALKPGGRLGIEEHRADDRLPQDPKASNGYVRQDYLVRLAEKAGFLWIGSSEVNANPKDTKDYPKGVWTLPPSYELGDQDRAKYQEIGESDRAILLFLKPSH
jgi:predicted methyltransferase